jgi:hypothetical protein
MLRTRKALVLAIFLAAGSLYYQLFLFLPRAENARTAKGLIGYHYGGDFYPIWLAGRLLARGRINLYSAETTALIQQSLYGHSLREPNPAGLPERYQSFVYPLHTVMLASPVIFFSFPTARIVLTVLVSLLSGLSVVFWLHAIDRSASYYEIAVLVVLTLTSLPLLEAVFAVQWGLVVAALLAVSFSAARCGKLVLSGFLLALATTKPQIMLLAALYLLFWSFAGWRQRKALPIAFFGTMAALLGASELVLPGWVSEWWHALMRYPGYTQAPLARGVLGGALGTMLTITLLVAILSIAWKARRFTVGSPTFSMGLALALTTTALTILHGDAIYDHEILLPAVLLVFMSWRTLLRRGPAVRVILAMTGLALCWQWIAASAVSFAALLLGRASVRQSDFALQLPLRASASFPFALVALLGLMAVPLIRESDGKQTPTSPQLDGS